MSSILARSLPTTRLSRISRGIRCAFRVVQLLQRLVEQPLRLGLQDLILRLCDGPSLRNRLAEGRAVLEREAAPHQRRAPGHPDAARAAGATVAFIDQYKVVALERPGGHRLVAHLVGEFGDLDHVKPTAPETGISHAFKVLKIEGYEDTLNNLDLKRSEAQASLLDGFSADKRDDYLMSYMLDVEAKGSLLSVQDFRKPFDYTLKVAVDSAGAWEQRKVDLVETFNYLIGLTVRSIDIQLRQGFATVEGLLPTGERTLILWRDCEKVGYEELTRLCDKLAINPSDSEFDVVYINGDHNIPSVVETTEEEGSVIKKLMLRQIEPAFLDAMFNVDDV
jgi:hypothetical protein